MCRKAKPESTEVLHTFRDGSQLKVLIWHDMDDPISPEEWDGHGKIEIMNHYRHDLKNKKLTKILRSYHDGYVWLPDENLRKEYREKFRSIRSENPKMKRAQIESMADAWWDDYIKPILKSWQQYLDGEIYGFQLMHIGLERECEPLEVSSCWGFYGDDHKELMSDVRISAARYLEDQVKMEGMMAC